MSLLRPRPARRPRKLFEKQAPIFSRQPSASASALNLIIMIILIIMISMIITRVDYHDYLAYHLDFLAMPRAKLPSNSKIRSTQVLKIAKKRGSLRCNCNGQGGGAGLGPSACPNPAIQGSFGISRSL